jgi:hypothetical protein
MFNNKSILFHCLWIKTFLLKIITFHNVCFCQYYRIIVVYGYGQNHIWGGCRGSDHCTCLTGSHGSDRMRMRGFSPRFIFSYYSSSTKCWCTWLNVPEGVPLGARMPNRASSPFYRVFWPEMTLPVGLKKNYGKKVRGNVL